MEELIGILAMLQEQISNLIIKVPVDDENKRVRVAVICSGESECVHLAGVINCNG